MVNTALQTYGNLKVIPQSQPLPNTNQILNSAGGFSFPISNLDRLNRFLVLGTSGGSYYASEQDLTTENLDFIKTLITDDGELVVKTLTEISTSNRAPKNDYAIFVLAMCVTYGNPLTRKAAFRSLDKVCRIPTHLFQFVTYCEQLGRGWGRGMRDGVANWYNSKSLDQLALQIVKYQSRDGWSNRDLFRLSHPIPRSTERQNLYRYIVKGEINYDTDDENVPDLPRIILGTETIKLAKTPSEAANLIRRYKLPREVVPTQFLTEKLVWEALLEVDMPMNAMIRNLANMTRYGVIAPLSTGTSYVTEQLGNQEKILRSRLHPLAILNAFFTYKAGHGVRGQNSWTPLPRVLEALEQAFYLSFGNVEPTGKRTLLAIDVSGSMSTDSIGGVEGLTPRWASAAMALVIANIEPNYHIIGFSDRMRELDISKQDTLNTAANKTNLSNSGTDCALPMIWAREQRVPVDTFIELTDNQTWAGDQHVSVALKEYRKSLQLPSRAVAVGMVANNFSVLDPNDAGSLNVTGFDLAAPQIIADFSRGSF